MCAALDSFYTIFGSLITLQRQSNAAHMKNLAVAQAQQYKSVSVPPTSPGFENQGINGLGELNAPSSNSSASSSRRPRSINNDRFLPKIRHTRKIRSSMSCDVSF